MENSSCNIDGSDSIIIYVLSYFKNVGLISLHSFFLAFSYITMHYLKILYLIIVFFEHKGNCPHEACGVDSINVSNDINFLGFAYLHTHAILTFTHFIGVILTLFFILYILLHTPFLTISHFNTLLSHTDTHKKKMLISQSTISSAGKV